MLSNIHVRTHLYSNVFIQNIIFQQPLLLVNKIEKFRFQPNNHGNQNGKFVNNQEVWCSNLGRSLAFLSEYFRDFSPSRKQLLIHYLKIVMEFLFASFRPNLPQLSSDPLLYNKGSLGNSFKSLIHLFHGDQKLLILQMINEFSAF